MTTSPFHNFLVRKNAPATKFFIIINFVIYFLTCFRENFDIQKLIQGPGINSLISFGAKENGLIAIGEIQRFFFQFFSMEI